MKYRETYQGVFTIVGLRVLSSALYSHCTVSIWSTGHWSERLWLGWFKYHSRIAEITDTILQYNKMAVASSESIYSYVKVRIVT